MLDNFFGEAGLFDEGSKRSAWVKTKTPCEIAEISYKKYRQLIQINPEILMFLTSQLSKRLQNTSRQVTNLAFFGCGRAYCSGAYAFSKNNLKP